jgi:4'-phosphopantetheinyl transferase
MLWLDAPEPAPSLPAVWLVASGRDARTRPERSALRHEISRGVIALQTGVAPIDILIQHEPSGQPVIRAERLAGLHLSHATRAGVVAVGLAETRIGVDVEEIGSGPIPLQALHRAEQLWLNQIEPAGREEAFARLWAVKEAYGKWAGVGLGEPDRFAALPAADGGWQVAGVPPATVLTHIFEARGKRFAAAVALG